MGEHTNISWCDHTFNAWIGCAKVSPACKYCYAEEATPTRVKRSQGLELWGANAARHVTSEDNWKHVARWNRAAIAAGERRRVFVNSLSDVMEIPGDEAQHAKLCAARVMLYMLIEECQGLDFLLLTKRPENYVKLLPAHWLQSPLRNVWLGTTAEDREHFNQRVGHLLNVPAACHYVSVEPQLEGIEVLDWLNAHRCRTCGLVRADSYDSGCECGGDLEHRPERHRVDWVICGGESGPKARPFQLSWARWLFAQCAEVGSAFFMKQLGSNPIDYTPAGYLPKHPKGAEPMEWPNDLRVRQFPEVK